MRYDTRIVPPDYYCKMETAKTKEEIEQCNKYYRDEEIHHYISMAALIIGIMAIIVIVKPLIKYLK